MKNFKPLLFFFGTFIFVMPAFGQVSLPIPDIKQIGANWCWADVAEQIIRAKNGGTGPHQCELVSLSLGAAAPVCCSPPNAMVAHTCNQKAGALTEIQAAIAYFGHSMSRITPPGMPNQLYTELANGHAVVIAIRTSPVSGHVIVAKGMMVDSMGNPFVQVNDPAGQIPPLIPFVHLMGYWQAAIVVH